jgi:hypothetical protein
MDRSWESWLQFSGPEWGANVKARAMWKMWKKDGALVKVTGQVSVHLINWTPAALPNQIAAGKPPELSDVRPLFYGTSHSTWLQCLASSDSVYDYSTTTFPFPKHDPSALSPLHLPLCHGV